ncbi:nodulin homeobox-like isoform X1 [Zingiber officinale]|uniref:nodulin homeobox-like isoform X1 n=1 Tax=Zingiber officinale TaxID=94328 RepID=UPI001C4AEA35|nr:nodulin homeobox-like isoform X1 [Zingiber officinale]
MIEIISAIGELNGLSSQELNKLLKDSENFTVECKTDKGFLEQINMEKLAYSLPLHLIATLLSPEREMQMGHVLRGVRLLHTLSDLASRHARLEQILLDDTKLSEQVLDLVLFMLIILARHKEDNSVGSSAVLHSTLVACSLYILTSCLSSQWHDLVHVLLAHPKADLFMDVAFDAVHEDIRILGTVLQTLSNELSGNISLLPAAGRTAHYICQQCEASLQFLLSLCQQKLFQDRVLRNKELCKHGGILSLAYSILKLNVPHNLEKSLDIVAAISRLKSKILSILLQLCESESLSYLDEVAGSPKSMHLAKAVALEFLDLLRVTFRSEGKQLDGPQYRSNPTGLLLLNALRLADIFSDDSNFRSFFMTNSIPVLADILSVPHEEFSLCWCSLKIPVVEEDATLEYDPFIAAGVALISLDNASENSHLAAFLLPEIDSTCPINFSGMPLATYAQQRISYLVKIIANLHVFVPNICEEEERDLFLNNFHKYLLQENPESLGHHSGFNIQKATRVCKNLGSLSRYAISLTPNCLTDEDVLLLSKYADELQKLTRAKVGDSFFQETVVKAEDEDVKSEYGCLVQQSSLSGQKNSNSNFSRSHQQETEYATGNSSSFTRKQDESAWEDGPKLSYNDVDVKGKIREISRCQDLLQQKVMRHSGNDQFEEFEVNHERKRNSMDQPESMRGGEKENTESELKGTGLHLNKMDFDSMPDNRHFPQSEYLTESCLPEDEKAENGQGEEKQPRKRKRNIMNEIQILMIEKALLDEPEMQRNPVALQAWSDKLSLQGSEITASQLKNWVNNRKAKLARAAREARAPSEGDISYPDKSSGPCSSHFCDSPESPTEENYAAPGRGISHQTISRTGSIVTRSARCEDMDMSTPTDFVHRSQQNQAPLRSHLFEPGQLVSMEDAEGNLVGKGQIIQVEGRWHGKSLEESGICIVDVTELKVEKWKEVQHPSDAAGHTFEEAMAKNSGTMWVAWDAARLALLP